jgi:predicted O-methyltransferase YrrM
LHTDEQLSLLKSLKPFYDELPFTDEKREGLRYYFRNNCYGHSDAIFLYSMLRYLKPKNLIEVGSGFTSAVTLDTNELFLRNSIHCTFVEPYPNRLKSLLKKEDAAVITLYEKRLQDVSLDLFKTLGTNDILFIDSSHVSKLDSDVNYIIHSILPALSKGVYIHFHDVDYSFEYPREWLLQGWSWNEQYILRAFLEYNNTFQIVLFNTYLQLFFEDMIKKDFPLVFKDTGGSIWLKKCL